MIEKIIEVYASRPDGLDFSRPAFDIRFFQSGLVDGHCHDHQWADLSTRIVFDIVEQLRPRGKLNEGSARAVAEFQVLARKVKLPPQLERGIEDLPAPTREPRSFDEILEWLRADLARFGLGLRVSTMGGWSL